MKEKSQYLHSQSVDKDNLEFSHNQIKMIVINYQNLKTLKYNFKLEFK